MVKLFTNKVGRKCPFMFSMWPTLLTKFINFKNFRIICETVNYITIISIYLNYLLQYLL